jgi:hypothetical protein
MADVLKAPHLHHGRVARADRIGAVTTSG